MELETGNDELTMIFIYLEKGYEMVMGKTKNIAKVYIESIQSFMRR